MISVGLVDNHQLVRAGIAGLLALNNKTQVQWQADNGARALELVEQQPVDIILADIRMPVMDGISLVKALRHKAILTPVLMLTTFDDSELFAQSLAAGANGFLLKDVSLEKLIHSIEALVAGEFVSNAAMLNQWRQQQTNTSARICLTPREQHILQLLVGGFSNKEIGRAVFLAEGTVRNHVSHILAKLDCRDRTQAVVKALEMGLV